MGAADSKLAFKKGVFRLFEERNIPSSAFEYWEQFWTLPESADDVFLLVGSQDIRRVRDEARENLECLIIKVGRSDEGQQQIEIEFPTPNAPAIQVLNCVRILTRLFPFIFESEDFIQWEEQFFWNKHSTTACQEDRSKPVLEGGDELLSGHPRSLVNTTEVHEEPTPSRGQRLIKTLLDLLFTSGFTLPTAMEARFRVSYVIWETGIGSSKPIGASKDLDDNRTEILRLLLVLFSRSMYIAPGAITVTENRWIDTVVTGSDRQTTLAILCSLINSALKYNPSGWGLPYNHVMFSDQRELLVMLCLQVIVVLLDYDAERPLGHGDGLLSPGDPHVEHQQILKGEQSSAGPVTSSTPSQPAVPEHSIKNQFCFYLSRLHREQDFMFLADGMYRILSNPMTASSTYLPGSTKQVKCHYETLMLCWKTLELNKRFRNYLLDTNRVLDIVIMLLYFALEHMQDTVHIDLVKMCAYILQTLSKDRAFGSCLNKPFEGHASLPASVRIQSFHGTYGDYLICSVYNLISTTKRTLRSLYPALISTLANVSPYLKNISPLASSRLLQLTTSFASPSFLLAEESNHELLGILLDTVCNTLYYQAPHNPHMVYTLVQYEPKIQTIAGFTLQRGLDDIHKLRYQKIDSSRTARSVGEMGSQPRTPEGRHRRPTTSRHQSYQSSRDSSSQPQQKGKEPQPFGLEETTSMELSLSGASSLSHPPTSYASTSTPSLSASSSFEAALTLAPALSDVRPEMLSLMRPDSSDSVLAPPSDGGGHEGDVEDEGGPSTVLKTSKERAIHGLSEKARGKLPETSHLDRTFASSFPGEAPNCDTDGQVPEPDCDARLSHSKRSLAGKRPYLTTHRSSYRREQATTAYDVGQNGFVPTEEWVQAWMGALRFEPLLSMLRRVIPEIESIHAVNDHQVLDFIRGHITPKLQQVLPESGRPSKTVRRFVWGELAVWFEGLLWSQVYLGGGGRLGRQGLGIWHDTGVKLFTVRTVPASMGAAAAVSSNVANVAAAAIRVAESTFTVTSESIPSPISSHRYHRASFSGPSSSGASTNSRSSLPEGRRTSIPGTLVSAPT
ncbi:hypothetical protein EDD11_005531 [Mortierella claussenii]|nr:hypothetical protein EDD11_005531 [Mortierella claussenii]